MAPKQRSAAKQILAALDADPALIEHYDPNEIEAIPLAFVQSRLIELGLMPAIPVRLQRLIWQSMPSPAADVLHVLADDVDCQPQSLETRPLAQVTACLQRRGTNYRPGVAAIIDFVGERASASAGLDQAKVGARSARFLSRKSLYLTSIGFAATATAAAAATVGFFVTSEARQDKTIADQQYEIRELSNQVKGLKARLKEFKDGADDLISVTMLIPPSNSLEHRRWPPQSADASAPAAGVGPAPEASLSSGPDMPEALPGALRAEDIDAGQKSPHDGSAASAPTMRGQMRRGNLTPAVGVAPEFGAGIKAWSRAMQTGDFEAAQKSLEDTARAGDVMSLWKLGRMYADGDNVNQSDLRAFEYFRTLADTHADVAPATGPAVFVASAFVALGSYYLTGIPNSDIKPDPVRAREMYNYAATYFANVDAQYRLGRMYLGGQGIGQDAKQAVRWLSIAAGKGHHEAQALFGAMLFNGESIPRDAARGLMYLILARDAASASPKEAWIPALCNAALKQATADEQALAQVHVEHWIDQSHNERHE
jgi:uncharacterized protein